MPWRQAEGETVGLASLVFATCGFDVESLLHLCAKCPTIMDVAHEVDSVVFPVRVHHYDYKPPTSPDPNPPAFSVDSLPSVPRPRFLPPQKQVRGLGLVIYRHLHAAPADSIAALPLISGPDTLEKNRGWSAAGVAVAIAVVDDASVDEGCDVGDAIVVTKSTVITESLFSPKYSRFEIRILERAGSEQAELTASERRQ